jgi:hypothetical protein
MEEFASMPYCGDWIGPDTRESGAVIEYVGEFGMTVVGDITHRPYLFRRPGARVGVDERDVFSLLSIPILRRVR